MSEPEKLPPLDQIRPAHVAYVQALVAKYAITPTYEREDLVQQILLQAHRSKHSPLEPKALLFGITRHVVYRWMRAHREEQAAIAAQYEQAAEEVAASPEEIHVAFDRHDLVHEAIEALPDIFREVFVRCDIEGQTMPEVAAEQGIPVNTGYTRLYLARERFAEAVKRILARRRLDPEDL